MAIPHLDSYLILIVQLAAAVVLITAGSLKLADPSAIRMTIGALGLPRPSILAFLLGGWELAAGLALVLLPDSPVTAGLVLALAGSFAVAGLLALHRQLKVDCACFAASLPGPLGWRQVLLTPVWLATASTVFGGPGVMREERLEIAFLLISLVAAGGLFRLVPLLVVHRAQRQALDRG